MRYRVEPGLYAVGKPDESSPVFVSANYKLSFDALRSSLDDLSAYILVLDTGGINVWCAAGKGTFGTQELISRIRETGIDKLVRHRRIVVPQLGAPGIRAHIVQKETGFRVFYGPVRANEIVQYIKNGFKATEEMRRVGFTLRDRLVLTPVEISQIWKQFFLYAAIVLFLFGLQPEGIMFREAVTGGYRFILLGLLVIFAGALLTPVLLPVLPFRAFSLKGLISGIVVCALFWILLLRRADAGIYLTAIVFLFYPAVSSFLALNFTGATPLTNISGVTKEVRVAVPFYIAAIAVSFVLFMLYKLDIWGVF